MNSILDEKVKAIRALAAAGLVVFPLEGNTKEPRRGLLWRDVRHGQYGEKELADCNYGVALGPDDVVIDVDRRNFKPGDNPLKRLSAVVGQSLDSFIVGTGGGGLHIFLKIPCGLRLVGKIKGYDGIDVKHSGGYVVGIGSIHPDTGRLYEIRRGSPDKIAQAPQRLLDLIARPASSFETGSGTGAYIDDEATRRRYVDYLTKKAPLSIQGQNGDATAFIVAVNGRDLALPPQTTLELMLEHWDGRCEPPWGESDLRDKVSHAYRYANNPVGNAHPSRQRPGCCGKLKSVTSG